MPVIIDEVVITVEVNSQIPRTSATELSAAQKRECVDECVEKVIKILNQKTRRGK